MQFPSQAEKVDPIRFDDQVVAGILVRRAFIEKDIVIQVLKGTRPLPSHAAERTAKALIDTVGEPAMDRVKIELINSDLVEGGESVYVKCLDMNTEVAKSIMFPRIYQTLLETMQVS